MPASRPTPSGEKETLHSARADMVSKLARFLSMSVSHRHTLRQTLLAVTRMTGGERQLEHSGTYSTADGCLKHTPDDLSGTTSQGCRNASSALRKALLG